MEGGGLFNQGFVGQGFNWWIGQIPDDSTWRDNIIPGKFDNKEALKGWGRRYKVRIIGLHDRGEESIPSKNLPWAQVMYPITAGGGQGEVYQTPGIRQGNFVFGFFMDGQDGQVPVIMGILGNNTQTALEMATSLQGPGDDDSKKAENYSPISGFAEPKIDKKQAQEIVPKYGLVTKKPTTKDRAQEEAGSENTPAVLADIESAKVELESMESGWRSQGKSDEEIRELSQTYTEEVVNKGKQDRAKESNSPFSQSQPGPTLENSDNPHLTSSSDIGREDKCREKIVLLKPDDIVGSSITATQTAMDNMAAKADKYFKSLQTYGYPEAVSMPPGFNKPGDLNKYMEKTTQEISKYMKVPFQKMMEYTNKTVNKELTSKVSALPSCMRYQFADVKDMTGEATLESYGKMTNGLFNKIGPILEQMFNLGPIEKAIRSNNASSPQFDTIEDAITTLKNGRERSIAALYLQYAKRNPHRSELDDWNEKGTELLIIEATLKEYDWSEDIKNRHQAFKSSMPITVPAVPICTAEDLLGRVLYSNKSDIDHINHSTLTYLDAFLEDVKSQIGGTANSETEVPNPVSGIPYRAIVQINDEEVLGRTRGGTEYTTANNLKTFWVDNINPGITTSPGRGAIVNVGVSTGGLGKDSGGSSIGFSWINQGSGYSNTNAVSCSIVGTGQGSGMKVNIVTSGGSITDIYTHTAGTNYLDNTMMRIDSGNFDATFTMNDVYGAVNAGGISVVNPGSQYVFGDVLGIEGGNNDATFTISGVNDPGSGQANGGKGQSLSDLIGMIGNLGGNISAALNFENMTSNLFPFELPPNPAVSDLYQFVRGGSGSEEPEMPSFGAVGKVVDEIQSKSSVEGYIEDKIPPERPGLPFVQPSMGEPDLLFNGKNLDTVMDIDYDKLVESKLNNVSEKVYE